MSAEEKENKESLERDAEKGEGSSDATEQEVGNTETKAGVETESEAASPDTAAAAATTPSPPEPAMPASSSPTSEKALPTSQKGSPTSEKALPTSQKASPTSEKASPALEKASPTSDKALPTSEKASPISQKASPTSEKATPAPEKASPTSEKATPAPEKDSEDTDAANKSPHDSDNEKEETGITEGLLSKEKEAESPKTSGRGLVPPPGPIENGDCNVPIKQDTDYDRREPHKQKLMRYLRRKEVVLCMLGFVTFVAGIILIVVALITIQSGCEVPAANGDNSGSIWDNGDISHINISSAGQVNLAADRPAFQSTSEMAPDGGVYNASLATDKNHGHSLSADGCAQTKRELRPFWYVDLGRPQVVKRVAILGASDCCAGGLHNFEVRVGQSEDMAENALCREHLGTALKVSITIMCDKHIYGRFVSIQILGDEARKQNRLTLCDVMIYAG